MSVAIKVDSLSKAYQIGQIGTGTLSLDIERWWLTKVMKKEDPFLKLGEVNDRTTKSETNIVWSLKDVDLQIQQGEAVGIIGRNGAGKSTLLKLLSRVTSPTTGSIKIKGRVASLLEIGTGFHPELTGRENIFLNGAILGMRKKEIARKLDEIVDFSGIERYIDTPVKRYSSGMYVRLAFAVAAHLESEVLIVDEVLAVGDAEFQKKCLGKMEEVGQRDGRTILFVSHNMGAVRELCRRGIQIDSGQIVFDGTTTECIGHYSRHETPRNPVHSRSQFVTLDNLRVNGSAAPSLSRGEPSVLSIEIHAESIAEPALFFIVENSFGQSVIHVSVNSKDLGYRTLKGGYRLEVELPPLWLTPGLYTVYSKFLSRSMGRAARSQSDRLPLEITGPFDRTGKTLLSPKVAWNIEPLVDGGVDLRHIDTISEPQSLS